MLSTDAWSALSAFALLVALGAAIEAMF